ncbi:MAG: Hsp20/alpha crystallin family protein [Nitrospirae bacterium]|nr:Hsp20/alpha crystallin family protein [Nitrospirota bacterium]
MKSVHKGICLYHTESSVLPLIDLYETVGELVFEIDLPGIEPDDVSIIVWGDMLVIEGVRKDAGGEAGLRYICMERGLRRFRRMIKFPHPVNVDEGEASYARGVISVRFPKREIKSIAIAVKRVAE